MEEAKVLDMSNLKRKNLSKPPSRKMEVSWKEETLKSKLSSEKKNKQNKNDQLNTKSYNFYKYYNNYKLYNNF